MFSIAVKEPGRLKLVDIPEPTPGPYEVKVKTEVATLCNATDRKLIDAHFPGVENYPLLLGHESVGIVVEVGEKVKTYKTGDRAIGGLLLNPTDELYFSGWGGFSEYTILKDHQAMVKDGVADEKHGWVEVNEIQTRVTREIAVEDAVMLCTWREVYGGLEDFQLRGDDIQKIVIFGGGPVGLSFLKLLKTLNKEFVAVIDPLKEKRAIALKTGADKVFSPDDQNLNQLTGIDAIVDAVGNEGIINQGISMVKMAGSVCVYGVIDKPVVQLNKSTGPYNFNLYIHQWPTRFRELAAQKPLVELIKGGKLTYKDFITAELPVDKINEAVKLSRKTQQLKILLRY